MTRLLGGCVGRLLVAVLVVGILALAWYNRDVVMSAWDQLRGTDTRPSPALAAQADEKLATLENGGVGQVALTESELQSLLDYRWSGFLPDDVIDPRITLSDGRLSLEAGVATARFGRIAELRDYAAFLPDTTELRAVGIFVPLDQRHIALEVHELGAANIPIPRQMIPTFLSRFPRVEGTAPAPNAVAVPLPPGIGNVFISGDSMVFVASRAPTE